MALDEEEFRELEQHCRWGYKLFISQNLCLRHSTSFTQSFTAVWLNYQVLPHTTYFCPQSCIVIIESC